ncbi:hypothetical protein F511_39126 [Dorcoceras hygrometricum]|uniref:Uncharacterized protein n=1 Tax=Dorcoceras hygrometricum TaxID=472368 RepID=A0A2Z7BIP1_9LAMI|nr:hypothetical protein F511_39126 [Dorcoceras hygrometricum]
MQRLPAATSTIETTTYASHATVTIYNKFYQLQATVPLTRIDSKNAADSILIEIRPL